MTVKGRAYWGCHDRAALFPRLGPCYRLACRWRDLKEKVGPGMVGFFRIMLTRLVRLDWPLEDEFLRGNPILPSPFRST